ncbi:unnamed protein product [Blepharisma stoltei]|uniref:Uncharacterized protein n=1 Tax=Blepharisma stoltei TaxID=1481888 RepID=A0AAU9K4W9_9CILI|nr:unnamed protein product [Blepharisma stoltei]
MELMQIFEPEGTMRLNMRGNALLLELCPALCISRSIWSFPIQLMFLTRFLSIHAEKQKKQYLSFFQEKIRK